MPLTDSREPIQGRRFNMGHNSATELARKIGAEYGWFLREDDVVVNDADAIVAETLEDLAFAMDELSWINSQGILWSAMPHRNNPAEAEKALSTVLDSEGQSPRLRARPRREWANL